MGLIIGVGIYLAIGIALLIWMVAKEPWGGLALHFWWVIIFFYPFLIVRMFFSR